MTTENTAPALAAATLAHTTGRVTIPADMDPIVVLGVADQVLRALERGFPHVRFLVTGREISLAGTQADIDVAAGLLEELIGMARRGTALDATAVEQAIGLLGRLTSGEAPTEEILSARGRSIRPRPPARRPTRTPSTAPPSSSASAPRAPARPTWRWPRPCAASSPARSAASS